MNTELAPGTRFAGYRVEALIGRGAMAEVYRARDDAGQAVALKLLDAASAQDERLDRKSTRLNSSHMSISYAVFCLKKKKNLDLVNRPVASFGAPDKNALPNPLPGRLCEPSLFRHVIFLIIENTTYDEVYLDIKKGR